jgi:hypothetical protein
LVPERRIAVNAPAPRPHEDAEVTKDVMVFGDKCDELIAPVVVHPSADCVSTR